MNEQNKQIEQERKTSINKEHENNTYNKTYKYKNKLIKRENNEQKTQPRNK